MCLRQPGDPNQMQSLKGDRARDGGGDRGRALGHFRVTPVFVGGHPANANIWIMHLRENFGPLEQCGFI